MSELATNSVRHAGCGESDELAMEADVRHERRGAAGRAARRARRRRHGGYGLVLLEHLSDRWGIQRDGGFSVWFEVERDRLPFGDEPAPERDDLRPAEPKLVRKLRARQAEHKQRGRLYRWAFVLVGVDPRRGIAMLALPGPAFVVIPVGLAILSLEFTWAERLLEKALVKGEEAAQGGAASPAQKASASRPPSARRRGVAAAVVWDIPFCPSDSVAFGPWRARRVALGSGAWVMRRQCPDQTAFGSPQRASAPAPASARAASGRTTGSCCATSAATPRPAPS